MELFAFRHRCLCGPEHAMAPSKTSSRQENLPHTSNYFDFVSRIVFSIAAGILMLFAVVMTCDAVAQFVKAAFSGEGIGLTALGGIGYVVVAVAVFDVSKYLIEEEVIRGREMRVASEARRSLTRFVSTIAIAVFLEALVTIFRVARENVPNLPYPTALLLAGILLIVGLGIYQRLSASVERRDGGHHTVDKS
jgi:hypothetical protein